MRTVRDYKNVQLGYISLSEQHSHLLPSVTESPEYQALTPEEQAHLEQADCPRPALNAQCNEWWWYGSSVVVNGSQAVQAV